MLWKISTKLNEKDPLTIYEVNISFNDFHFVDFLSHTDEKFRM